MTDNNGSNVLHLKIDYDPKTGGLALSDFPPDPVLALGILELSKAAYMRMIESQGAEVSGGHSPIVKPPPGMRLKT